jgi:hypothetical protein
MVVSDLVEETTWKASILSSLSYMIVFSYLSPKFHKAKVLIVFLLYLFNIQFVSIPFFTSYFLSVFSFSLGLYTMVFQAELYAIKAWADENIKRGYHNRNIYILSGTQAAIKALDNCKIYSELVWDCHQSLTTLAVHIKVYFMWVPGHRGIHGNEIADQLARMGSLCPFIGTWTCLQHFWKCSKASHHRLGLQGTP